MQWLENSDSELPKKSSKFLSDALHGTQKHMPFENRNIMEDLPTLCLMLLSCCRSHHRIRRLRSPTSPAFTLSNTSLDASDDVFSTWEEKPIWGSLVVILHGLSHPVLWICCPIELFGLMRLMFDSLMIRIDFNQQFSAPHFNWQESPC